MAFENILSVTCLDWSTTVYMYLYASLDTVLPPLHRWATEAQGKLGWGPESGTIPTSKCLKYGCLPDQWVSTLYLQPTEIKRVWRVAKLDKCRSLLWDASQPDLSVTHHLLLRENTATSLEHWPMGPAAWGHGSHRVHYRFLYTLLSYLPDGHHSLESPPRAPRDRCFGHTQQQLHPGHCPPANKLNEFYGQEWTRRQIFR